MCHRVIHYMGFLNDAFKYFQNRMNIIYHKTKMDACASFVWFIPSRENDEARLVRDLSCSSGVRSPGSGPCLCETEQFPL